MSIPDEIQDLCSDLLQGLTSALDQKLYGVYLYGAVAFPECGATGDLDFQVLLKEPLREEERTALRDLEVKLARDHPPLGVGLDGYYLLLEDARGTSPPPHQLLPGVVDSSWALHRAHIRAGRCIVLYGPDPRAVYPPASWPELEQALEGEMEYVRQHLVDYPAYCVLNLCRLMYSYDTHDVVVSKRGSAAWAEEVFPQWHALIEAARKAYDQQATAQDQSLLASEVGAFFLFACKRIRESESSGGPTWR